MPSWINVRKQKCERTKKRQFGHGKSLDTSFIRYGIFIWFTPFHNFSSEAQVDYRLKRAFSTASTAVQECTSSSLCEHFVWSVIDPDIRHFLSFWRCGSRDVAHDNEDSAVHFDTAKWIKVTEKTEIKANMSQEQELIMIWNTNWTKFLAKKLPKVRIDPLSTYQAPWGWNVLWMECHITS